MGTQRHGPEEIKAMVEAVRAARAERAARPLIEVDPKGNLPEPELTLPGWALPDEPGDRLPHHRPEED